MATGRNERTEPDQPIAVSAIEHYAYCPRQCALIHVDGVWRDNRHTVVGQRGHRRADTFAARRERGVTVVRAVPLWSEALGLTGRADAVEFHEDGAVVPVEYKIGIRHGDAAHLQLAAQALCLEEMLGKPIERGALWFSGPRRRVAVAIDNELRTRAITIIEAVRHLVRTATLPRGVNDDRCDQCQLLGYCLPQVVEDPVALEAYIEDEVFGCGY